MVRFPKGLLLLAGVLELLILSVNGHATSIASAPPLPRITVVAAQPHVTPAETLRAPAVFGLVRYEPPKQETTKKERKRPSKRQAGLTE